MKRLILLLVLLFSTPGFGQVKMSPGSVASTVPWGQITGGITVQSDLISYIYKRAHMICVSDYANIHSAIDVLSTGDILMIDTYAACSKQDTIPADVYLAVRGGKFIDPKTYRLFIRANMLLVGDTKIFRVYSDSSRITITNNDLNPIWFGADRLAGNIDSTTQAFKNTFGSLRYYTSYVPAGDITYGKVIVPSGIYLLNDEIIINHTVVIEGEVTGNLTQSTRGSNFPLTLPIARSQIVQTAANKWIFKFMHDGYGFTMWGIGVHGLSLIDATADTNAAGAIYIEDRDHFFIEDNIIGEFQDGYGVYIDGSAEGSIYGRIEDNIFKNVRYMITSEGMFNAIVINNNRFASLVSSGVKLANNTGPAWAVNVKNYVHLENNVIDIQNWSSTGYKWVMIIQAFTGGSTMFNNWWDTNSTNGLKFDMTSAPNPSLPHLECWDKIGSSDTTLHIFGGPGLLRFYDFNSGLKVDENTYPNGTWFQYFNNVSGNIIRSWDYCPQLNELKTESGLLQYDNRFYNPILMDSTLVILGGKEKKTEPDFMICDPNGTAARRRMYAIEGNSQNRTNDTTWVYTQNWTSDKWKNFGIHRIHTRAFDYKWIAGSTNVGDTLPDGTPDIYGTSQYNSAMCYNDDGVLSLFNAADEFAYYTGADKNYIIAKATPNIPMGAKNGYGALYVSSAGEWTALDSSGNATPFSPHTPGEALPKSESGIDPNEWFFNSTNKDSIQISVNMFKVIEALEQVTGRQFIWKRDLKTGKSLRTFVKE